jgi:RimJ/RimL family protein N-acetyltransferase
MRFPDDVPTLTSGDVTLRAPRLDDAAAVVEQCVDPVSLRWTTVPEGYTLDMARTFLDESSSVAWETGADYRFAIESTHPGGERRFSGSISLRDEGSRRAELAFGAHPAIRGRGVMTEAVRLILDWGFDELDLETVIWWANRGNVGSRRIAWKAGFTFGGTARRWLDHRGEFPDAWVATLHRDDSREPKTRWLETPVLEGDGFRLRPLAERDVPRIREGCTDERTRHFLPFLPSPYTDDDGFEFLVHSAESASLGHSATWAVADAETDLHLANLGIPRVGGTDAEIGYWAHPAARGRGLVSRSVGRLVEYLFTDADAGGLGMERVCLKAAESNTASAHVARANGFTEVGRERRCEVLGDGVRHDLLTFDLLREEWVARDSAREGAGR